MLRSTTPAIGAAARKRTTLSGSIRVVAPRRSTETFADLGLTLVGKFNSPTFVVSPPGDTSRLLIVQQNGLVSLIKDGVVMPNPFLDLRSVVLGEGEKGLLSIAFAPDYATSGLVYAYFNNRDGNIRVIEYRRSATDPDVIDRTQRRVLISLTKQTADHNGGMMQFGPDGYLYIAVGDGGADPPRVAGGGHRANADRPLRQHPEDRPASWNAVCDPVHEPVRLDVRREARDRRLRPAEPVAVLDRPEAQHDDDRRRRRGSARGDRRAAALEARRGLRLAVQGGHHGAGQGDASRLLQHGDADAAGVAVPARRIALLDHGRRDRARPAAAGARRPLHLVGSL